MYVYMYIQSIKDLSNAVSDMSISSPSQHSPSHPTSQNHSSINNNLNTKRRFVNYNIPNNRKMHRPAPHDHTDSTSPYKITLINDEDLERINFSRDARLGKSSQNSQNSINRSNQTTNTPSSSSSSLASSSTSTLSKNSNQTNTRRQVSFSEGTASSRETPISPLPVVAGEIAGTSQVSEHVTTRGTTGHDMVDELDMLLGDSSDDDEKNSEIPRKELESSDVGNDNIAYDHEQSVDQEERDFDRLGDVYDYD